VLLPLGRNLQDVTKHCLKRELEDLILEQIYVLKQTAIMTDLDIFEFHLRHYQIMVLFKRLDRSTILGKDSLRGWLS